jgi:hypothetical protein
MANDIELSKLSSALAIFDKPGNVEPYLYVAKQIEGRDFSPVHMSHSKSMARFAVEERAKWLPFFAAADQACLAFWQLEREPLTRELAADMITALLGACGAKDDLEIMLGMLRLLQTGGLDDADENFVPLRASPIVLSRACQKLITKSRFPLKPADLYDACREANRRLWGAETTCQQAVEFIRRCDAILLEFADHAEWEKPYLTPQHRPILKRMLELHSIEGDRSESWDFDDEPNVFRALLDAEKAKLAPPRIAPLAPKRDRETDRKPPQRARRVRIKAPNDDARLPVKK